jgi:rRNA maturation endonuclease Nob1
MFGFLLAAVGIGIAIAIVAMPFMAVFKLGKAAVDGGFSKMVRCPSCTEKQEAPHNRPDYNCKRCGTPILRNREFVAKAQ